MTDHKEIENVTIDKEELLQQIKTDEIYASFLEDIANNAKANDVFIENFEFYGKTLLQHSHELFIKIPQKITPEDYRLIFVKIAQNIQKVTHYYNLSNAINSALSGGNTQKKAQIVQAIIKYYEKRKIRRPGQDVIDQLAESYVSNSSTMILSSKIIKDFWKTRLDSLTEMRKCMEQIGISMHSEMKYLDSSE